MRESLALGLGVLAVVGVACNRVYLDTHWFSDVAGNLTGGLAYVLWVFGWFERSSARAAQAGRTNESSLARRV